MLIERNKLLVVVLLSYSFTVCTASLSVQLLLLLLLLLFLLLDESCRFKFPLRNIRVLFALLVMMLTCSFHRRSEVIVTPRYFEVLAVANILPWSM